MKAWCVKNRDGGLLLWSIWPQRNQAVKAVVAQWGTPWSRLRKIGYIAVKVEVREVGDGAGANEGQGQGEGK